MDQTLTQNVDTLFTNMENFAQKEGLIGKAVTQGDKTFLPVISVTLGYGGGDTQSKSSQANAQASPSNGGNMQGGALGLGARLSTDAVIIIDKGTASLVPVSAAGGFSQNVTQMLDKVPQILSNMNPQQNQQK